VRRGRWDASASLMEPPGANRGCHRDRDRRRLARNPLPIWPRISGPDLVDSPAVVLASASCHASPTSLSAACPHRSHETSTNEMLRPPLQSAEYASRDFRPGPPITAWCCPWTSKKGECCWDDAVAESWLRLSKRCAAPTKSITRRSKQSGRRPCGHSFPTRENWSTLRRGQPRCRFCVGPRSRRPS
jgi:hypothetical protein